ncbi:MAG: site-specific DNA-methyltransferase [Actinomycetota bacterium]|nr:site-specific DNA-methyltransferase [Actinomycetota bacterium]
MVDVLRRKWDLHDETEARMADVIAEHGLSAAALTDALARSIGVERVEASGEGWLLACNDTVAEAELITDHSVDLIATSIPFGALYEYSAAVEDFGHNDTPEQFWAQMDHLTAHLLRILAPGRIYACHVKDRIVFGGATGAGYSTVYPFHAEAILHTMRHGFDFLGQITVTTDVVRENAQSYRLGWSEMCKDSTKMGCGTPEYILLFRAPQSDRTRGYADTPVTHDKADYSRARWQTDAHAYWRSDGNRLLAPADMDHLTSGRRAKLFEAWTAENVYDYEAHVKIGEHIDAKGQLPATFMLLAPASIEEAVWTEAEIVRMRTLNTEQSRRRLDLHVCPMAFTLVDRLIERFSNPGDLVYDPFGGIGTVVRQALLAGRRGRAVELNGGYFLDAVRYAQAAERKVNTPSLFDALDTLAEAAP